MDEEFERCVESGLKLAKRVYYGKDRFVSAPKPVEMEKISLTPPSYLPTAPMMFAVISNPSIVDNPDIPSYQPHVHGRCDPPALIPLHLNEMGMEVDCYFDTAFVTVCGSWRVHCVMASRSSDCRLVVPMGGQGSILGVEVDVAGRSYSTRLLQMEDTQDLEKIARDEYGGFLKPQMFSLIVPQVAGGSVLSIKVSWLQQLSYNDGEFSISVPFNFPEYVNPSGKRLATIERIQLNVNTGIAKEVICKKTSHPLKETRRQMGKLGFLYEAQVITWSTTEFCFSYMVCSNDIFGGLLLQSPSLHDFDQREMFCLYLFPGNRQNRKVFKREVIFLVDISGSMRGKSLENVKTALETTLSNFTRADAFNIIAFNEETFLFSSTLESANKETIDIANQWMSQYFVAGGGTNILQPLDKAMEILSDVHDSLCQIVLITDGAVEAERDICHSMKNHMTSRGSMSLRISTFGIGTYCNHYFLRTLALIGGGHYDAAYDTESINARMQRFLTTASSAALTNITIDTFDHLDSFEVHPFPIQDLSSEAPLILSGRYQGDFPDSLKAKGVQADMTNLVIDLQVQRAKDIPLDKVLAKRQIDLFTAQAWFSESKQLGEKATKISMQAGVISEYTRMVLLQIEREKHDPESVELKKVKKTSSRTASTKEPKIMLIGGLNVGFGNLTATAENVPIGFGEVNLQESEIAITKALRCCGGLAECCCGVCCIRICSKLNDQCVMAITQLCAALSCFGFLSCCIELCCDE